MAAKEVQQWLTVQDGLDKLYKGTASMPTPGKDEVLVKISTVSLNYRDTEVCMGLYSHHKALASAGHNPLVPCSDICGEVVAVGPDLATPWKVGDRVLSVYNHLQQTGHIEQWQMEQAGLGLPLQGTLQTYRVFPSIGLVAAPAYLSDVEASCLPIAAVTAWMSIYGPIESEDEKKKKKIVLLQGTGGVSISGLQIAHAGGATTIVTSSSDAKLDKARALGADYTINYNTTPRWADAVLDCTQGHGADIILDQGGVATLRQSFDAVAFGGRINCIGYLGGKREKRSKDSVEDDSEDTLGVTVLALRRNMTLQGILNGPRDRFEEMLEFYKDHKIHPVVDRVFAFDESPAALQYLFSGKHFGKVVIQVSS